MKSTLTIRFIALVILLASILAGIFAGVAIWQYRAFGEPLAMQALDTCQAVQTYVTKQNQRLLEQASSVVASNASFVGYITQALNASSVVGTTIDTTSIRDLLEERRNELGFDSIAILDPNGRLVASSGDDGLNYQSLSTNPLVANARATLKSASGILADDRRAFLVTLTPLVRGGDIEALLLIGQRADTGLVAEIARVSHGDIALLLRAQEGARVLASNLDPHMAEQLTTALPIMGDEIQRSTDDAYTAPTFGLNLGGQHWSARLAQLEGSGGKALLLAMVPPMSHETAAHAVVQPLLIASAVILLVLLVFALMIWRRWVRPLASLSKLSERALHGDYELEFRSSASGTIVRLGILFNHLLSELRRYRPAPGGPHRRVTDQKLLSARKG